MRKTVLISLAALTVAVISCGPSAEEKARIEQERADSLARVEAEKAAAKLEAERLDSIRHAQERLERWATDSVKIAELLPLVTVTKDKAIERNRTYTAKGVSSAHYRNGVFVSFTTEGTRLEDLYLNVELLSNDAFLPDRVLVIIDDKPTDLPREGEAMMDVDRVPYKVSEWMKCSIPSNVADKILGAESVKIKVEGSNSAEKLFTVSGNELDKMKDVISLYKLFKNNKVIE